MEVRRSTDVEPTPVTADAQGNPAKNTFIQVMVPDGPTFVLRVFTLEPGGNTPLHTHPFEHGVYVLSGAGKLGGTSDAAIGPGDAIYVAPDEKHCFVNTGDEPLRFICVVPKDA
jgi:quercetin dioxygenase-like cupin family protein